MISSNWKTLLKSLQAVDFDCIALQSITGGPRGRGNLADITQDPGIWATVCLRNFWKHHDEAQRALDYFPDDTLRNMQHVVGRPWKLVTRQMLDEIADAIAGTRPWFGANPDPAMQEAEQKAMLTAWEVADFSTWPRLLAKLKLLIQALRILCGLSKQQIREYLRQCPS
ncbi:MAG: hypothetical protein DDT35_01275 [Firmicutes bacterium]|nr:hypothetical protein [Bacillota bacterium]